jgi:pyridoxal phosphate enzyme (YggS family)
MNQHAELSFSERLEKVKARMQSACERAGRDISEIKLVAVAKGFGPEAVHEAVECGIRIIGESRVQEAAQKIPQCPSHLEWHMIGHLQRNKARLAVKLFKLIHSVDSIRLMEALERICGEMGVNLQILLEVNVAGDSHKTGFAPEMVDSVLEQAGRFIHLEIAGFMTIPPFSKDPEDARKYFRMLRELRDRCQAKFQMNLKELSMGMSNDFEIAIEEGATMVRIGTALFGERKKQGETECSTENV